MPQSGPDFWGRCPQCGTTWQFGDQPCQRCRVDSRLGELLGSGDAVVPAQFEEFRRALTGVERPDHAMLWLTKPKVRELLTRLGSQRRLITHEALDELPAGKTLDYLRALLVGSGTLPSRDERLVRLERWAHQVVDTRERTDERRVLLGYAIWHHLRRLRRRLNGQSATPLQITNVRTHINAAVAFLAYLAERGSSLGSCAQAALDDFLANTATYPQETAHFVRWAVAHRHTGNLSAPAKRWQGPGGPYGQDRR